MIIAIDGPAASGKGTVAKRIAARFDLAHLDTGLLYRAVALRVLREGGDDPLSRELAVTAAESLSLAELAEPALRGVELGPAASRVAAIADVRAALLGLQRRFAAAPPGGKQGAVLDGRDIGTVICPGADAKLYITAALSTRAERRFKELLAAGVNTIYSHVLQELAERDRRDTDRVAAPLKPATDAFLLDTSGLDADQAYEAAVQYILTKTGGARR